MFRVSFLTLSKHELMYRHANTNVNSSQPSDHDSTSSKSSSKSSDRQRREIPLAFTNTGWGREYASNPNWEHENLAKSNPAIRQRSRFRPESEINDSKPLPIATTLSSTHESANSSTSPSPSTTTASSSVTEVSREYSVMKAWGFFSRSLSPRTSPIASDRSDTEKRKTIYLEEQGSEETGPWLEMLMRWGHFEHWDLKMLSRSWYMPITP